LLERIGERQGPPVEELRELDEKKAVRLIEEMEFLFSAENKRYFADLPDQSAQLRAERASRIGL
jgi:hypothetical protein